MWGTLGLGNLGKEGARLPLETRPPTCYHAEGQNQVALVGVPTILGMLGPHPFGT